MSLQRILYITQGSMSVWEIRERVPHKQEEYADDDQGIAAFGDYIAAAPALNSAVLIDVIEEEFRLQSIPRLSWRDRRNLIERRCASAFRRTPYRASLFQGKSATETGQFTVVHSAIVNHELVDPWMQIMLQHCTPICGVYSVPHLAQSAVKRLFGTAQNSLFMAPHQGNKLRQVFTQNGNLRSARLSQSTSGDEHSFADAVVAEVKRSRRYFERNRLLGPLDTLDVRVVAAGDAAEQIEALAADSSSEEFTFIDPDVAAQKLGRRSGIPKHCFEQAYFSMLTRSQPTTSYATSGETRYWYMQGIRKAAIAGTVAVASVCAAFAAALLGDTWMLRNRAAEIDAQVQQLSETYRRENARFSPIKADSYEMKLAVDTGDFILANRVPVPWVMNQLGTVLGDFSDVHPKELSWNVVSPPQPERRQRPGEAALPVAVPTVDSVDAVLTAAIEPFDGDMRRAFARIDEFAAELQARTHFTSAQVVAYPIDTSTTASVAGEIVRHRVTEEASFRLRVSYRIDDVGPEVIDDAI